VAFKGILIGREYVTLYIVLTSMMSNDQLSGMRNPESNNQVFFIDTSGALCSRSSGHAIDIEGTGYSNDHSEREAGADSPAPDDCLVLRHRRPVSLPFPNSYSHPLPQFRYDKQTGEISVIFSSDPAYPPPGSSRTSSRSWANKSYLLSSIPIRKPPTLVDNAAAFISSAINTPLSFFTGPAAPTATPEEVFSGDIDLAEDEVLEEERGEEAEADDSDEPKRRVRMLTIVDKNERALGEKARARRQWEIIPLRTSLKRTSV